jgi:phosphoribosylformimino-5-aminoimidazole carboxamide ribotide isomerase
MDVIPVIDVQHGLAVHAARGERASYRPLKTPLAEGSDPVAVAVGLRSLFAFPLLYVADLDGIEGRGGNAELPDRLAGACPGLGLWIDDGASPQEAAGRLASASPATLVLGSESVRTAQDVAALRSLPRDRYVLSLDFRDDRFVGPEEVLAEADHWPDRAIVMTLARVGSGAGPDLERVADVVARAGRGRSVYASGGVRDRADIEALRQAGAAGVLVASALHSGKLTAGDLKTIAGRR